MILPNIALSTEVRSSLNSNYMEQSLGLRYSLRHTTFILQTSFYAPFAIYHRKIRRLFFSDPGQLCTSLIDVGIYITKQQHS